MKGRKRLKAESGDPLGNPNEDDREADLGPENEDGEGRFPPSSSFNRALKGHQHSDEHEDEPEEEEEEEEKEKDQERRDFILGDDDQDEDEDEDDEDERAEEEFSAWLAESVDKLAHLRMFELCDPVQELVWMGTRVIVGTASEKSREVHCLGIELEEDPLHDDTKDLHVISSGFSDLPSIRSMTGLGGSSKLFGISSVGGSDIEVWKLDDAEELERIATVATKDTKGTVFLQGSPDCLAHSASFGLVWSTKIDSFKETFRISMTEEESNIPAIGLQWKDPKTAQVLFSGSPHDSMVQMDLRSRKSEQLWQGGNSASNVVTFSVHPNDDRQIFSLTEEGILVQRDLRSPGSVVTKTTLDGLARLADPLKARMQISGSHPFISVSGFGAGVRVYSLDPQVLQREYSLPQFTYLGQQKLGCQEINTHRWAPTGGTTILSAGADTSLHCFAFHP